MTLIINTEALQSLTDIKAYLLFMVSVNYWLSKYYLAKNRTHKIATDVLLAINNIQESRIIYTLIMVILAVQT